jgi:hypothetical protein
VGAVCWPLAAALRESVPALVVAVITGLAGAAVAGVLLLLTRGFYRDEMAVLRRGSGRGRPA